MFTLVFFCVFQLSAQDNQGILFGRVIDDSKSELANAIIVITSHIQNSFERRVISKSDGTYQISNLPAGVYSVRIWHMGYKEFYRKKIRIKEGKKELNAKMRNTPPVKLGLPTDKHFL